MSILHKLRNLLEELLRHRVTKWAKLSYRTAKPGLRRDWLRKAELTPWRRPLKTRLLALNTGVWDLPTHQTWLKLLWTQAVWLPGPIHAVKPRTQLSIRIKHRCLLVEIASIFESRR